jgi:hypothetical protein
VIGSNVALRVRRPAAKQIGNASKLNSSAALPELAGERMSFSSLGVCDLLGQLYWNFAGRLRRSQGRLQVTERWRSVMLNRVDDIWLLLAG